MTEDVIEWYDTFNTKGYPDELIFGDFNDQPIPSKFYTLLNDDDYDGNNIPGTPIEDSLPEKTLLEYAVMSIDEEINDEKIIDDYYSLASDIDFLQNEILEIEGVEN